MLTELKKEGYLIERETLEHKKDSANIWVSANYKAIFNDKRDIDYIDGVIIDITERKQAELDLKKALNKATESDRLKSVFLATMSHELRTPLNAIIGFSDLINTKVSTEEVISYSKIINSSGNHLLTIVEDLFDITLIESGETKIHKKEENVHSILNDTYKIIQSEQQKANKDNLDLKLITPKKSEGITVITDPIKLKQILINLLKNALKFTHEGYVKYGFKIDQTNSMLEFFVEDTGIGIPKNKQELIFDIFRQVDETHTKMYGGTGIGLSISKKLVQLLGGEIKVKSIKGKGSTFCFTIPYVKNELDKGTDKSDAIKKSESKIASHHKKRMILIVEDDESSFEFLKVILNKSGIATLWAKNGEESIKICKENVDIDLILMDINMPVMNGYEATKLIKAFKPKLPIMAQTAYAIAGDEQKALDAGCDDYIAKPINKKTLVKKIEQLLSFK